MSNADGGDTAGRHTPLPWELRRGDPAKENLVAVVRGLTIYGPYAAASCGADAAYIVQACNAYPALVEALKEELDIYDGMDKSTLRPQTIARIERLRAALALAGVRDE